MKKIILSILLINTCLVYAGPKKATCDIDNLEKPCNSMPWNIEGGVLYLKSEYKYLPFSTASTEDISRGADQPTFLLRPHYGWGFFVDGSLFIESNRDLNVNLYYLDTDTSAIHSLQTDGYLWGNMAPAWFAINLELGQTMNINSLNDLRLFASIAYAWLRVKTTYDSYIAVTRDYPNSHAERLAFGNGQVKFNGIGPRLGANLYNPTAGASWMNGFRFYAKGAGSVLFGTSESRFFYSDVGHFAKSSTVAVPAVDAKLGFDVTPAFFKHYITFDVGLTGAAYFFSVLNSSYDRKTVFFQGIYIGAKWSGNMM